LSIILLQTDTTVGFLSQNSEKLFEIKSRQQIKPFLKFYKTFQSLKLDLRVPNSQKNLIRRSKKTTFIVKNQAFRVSSLHLNSQVIRNFIWQYSTSANASGKKFNRSFCEDKSDITIEDKKKLSEKKSSIILKLNEKKIRRLR